MAQSGSRPRFPGARRQAINRPTQSFSVECSCLIRERSVLPGTEIRLHVFAYESPEGFNGVNQLTRENHSSGLTPRYYIHGQITPCYKALGNKEQGRMLTFKTSVKQSLKRFIHPGLDLEVGLGRREKSRS